SPALAALLLKPRAKGSYEALPRLSFLIAGAWAGYQFLGEGLGLLAGKLPPGQAAQVQALVGWWTPWVGAALGLLAGWAVSRPLNWLLGWVFGTFNDWFNY